MRVPQVSQRSAAATNMTPMIDVVFLLIIFFLVSSHLAKRETRMPLDLPSAKSIDSGIESADRLTIQIADGGQIQIGAVPTSPERLSSLLIAHQRDHGAASAVRIRTDKTVPYGVVEPLLREIAGAGIVDIAFAVRENQ